MVYVSVRGSSTNLGCAEKISNRLNNSAGRYGKKVSRWPNVTRLLAVVFFLATCTGLLDFHLEWETYKLYAPEGSIERENLLRRESAPWELSMYDRNIFEIAMHSNGENVLTSDGIETWKNFMDAVTSEHRTVGLYDPMRMKYYFLDHFSDDQVTLPTPDGEFYFPWQTNDSWRPAMQYEAPLTATMIAKPRDSSGNAIMLHESLLVDSAEALRASWTYEYDYLYDTLEMAETCAVIDNNMTGSFEFSWSSNVGIAEELENSFIKDVPKFGAAILLLMIITVCLLWRRDLIRNKTILILIGFLSSVMAVISSTGFGIGIGHPESFNQLVGFMPFLILSIGMDDLFVLIRSYELTAPNLSAEQRIAATMYDGGMSITITSLTDFVALLGGGIMVEMPAVRDLCLFSAYAIFFLYFYCVTLVLSALVCQARREEQGSVNCCSCRYCGSTVGSCGATGSSIVEDSVNLSGPSTESMAQIGMLPPHFTQFLTRNVSKLWWQITVFSFSLGYLVIMSIGAVNIFNKVGLDFRILAPKGSYLVDWYDVRDRFLDETAGYIAYLIVDDEDCDYGDEEIKDALVSVYDSMSEVDCILGDLGYSWIDRIENCLEIGCEESCRNTNWTTCYNWFERDGTWSGDYSSWRGKFLDDSNRIPKATQMLLQMRAAEIQSFDRVECLEGIYSRLEDAPCNMIAWNDMFPFYAGDKTTVSGTWQTMVCAVFSCLVVCLIFIPNIYIVLIIIFCIAFLLVGVLGSTYYLDYRLDSAAQVTFIMGIGFAVDFAVHVSHSFLHAKGTKVEKVGEAIGAMGEAIFLSAITTILGVALLLSSSSVILVFLASLLMIIMIIGLYIAAVLLPTMLACMGPEDTKDKEEENLGVNTELTTVQIGDQH